jgi:A/G-specific adenine glycosylase
MSTTRVSRLRAAVIRWYGRHGRDLPWRRTRDPYAVLVSEIMLQQTQVDRVVPKYERFIERFPTFAALASAPLGDVLRLWSGLGYNSRARRLWESSKRIAGLPDARHPTVSAALPALPGVGRYTAAAVASFAFEERVAVVDTNVRRVLSRALAGVDDVGEKEAWLLAETSLPRTDHDRWNQALMDVGALFCRPVPRCDACPARGACRFARSARLVAQAKGRAVATRPRQSRYEGSHRYYRGRAIKALAKAPSMTFRALGAQVKEGFQKSDLPWLEELLEDLRRDGLIAVDPRKKRARLP